MAAVIFCALVVSSCNFGDGNNTEQSVNPSENKNEADSNINNLPNDSNVGGAENDNAQANNEQLPEDGETPADSENNNHIKPENDESSNNGNSTNNNTHDKPENQTQTADNKKPNNTVKNDEDGEASNQGQGKDVYLTDPALLETWNELDDIALAGQTYYTENFSKTRIITKDGYLYNKAAEEKIDLRYLVAKGYLSSKYVTKKCDLLLLKASDLKNYSSLYIKDSETELVVAAAVPHPNENMYLLTTARSAGGAISSAQYASLLNGYYQNNGTVGHLSYGAADYERILSFISMYESKYEEYFVRSITSDNKYAVVILSETSTPSDVRQYVLRRSGSIWEVVMSGLETDPRALISVNKALPDFNLNLLPEYTINDYLVSLNKDKSQLVGEMTAKGYITGAADIEYICGTSNFVYIVLKNEQKYICNNTGSEWNVVQVSTSSEAISKMLSINKSAPTFIVLDR